jgi:hypothetical protein
LHFKKGSFNQNNLISLYLISEIGYQTSSKTRQEVNLLSTTQKISSSYPANQAGQEEADDGTLKVSFGCTGHN